ncbi:MULTISPECIES: formyltetrahydrofolate deformylase [Bacillus]|uniref:Formyltetrahydrofolate deformylase n=1 Tax=Bacillus amyloliquefaciens (strain ATCC 23350 / DSM 7 / BCRC 11601 / CCUG 28519 / NBRC 15535 / NRRL B-14393 / F) TaxID=692420 RepID=A0A9P1JGX4_BACAS|nr:formyltetrahydrofolate deformylase [Bacillus amyloliquefaciens]AEB24285.1 formyltetrahydrofolate deformylase [Bacillus amyloliquefaciens TA208]AEB62951.1 formyltetrahydrofolate hydrolase [Bacillus amyloliquefaciens LL3]AEK89297.1 formyltetrahydrofolate deformylase [Bacillus amyloliquefaciens XH7]ARW38594.1 Formyltetrahydrofolate deformylase [Bacillus amyloliquefaciens]AZV88845.1 formyltetrahydrofolate deformylase [Bacillus amyloliquefaciens]
MNSYMTQRLNDYREGNEEKGRLLVSCPDQPGIVSAVSAFLFEHGANIIESNQYTTDPEGGRFFLRIEFDCKGIREKKEDLKQAFALIAQTFGMTWSLSLASELKRVAIFVSKELHCLHELIWEWQSGNMMAEIAVVISNHEEAKEVVEPLNIPFHYMKANKDIRAEVERRQLELLEQYEIDVIVLARYMQILTSDFVSAHPNRIINIHHSFLPAFIGANPYKRAYERGVKLIGATSHYVTDDLDEGPIIEQDIERVDHRDHAEDLKNIGRTIERSVLARAVKWHLEDRVIVHENKTIVFN